MTHHKPSTLFHAALALGCISLLGGCISAAPEGLAPAPAAGTTVLFDFEAKPLPEIPLPNDIATRYDETSPTGRRLNASKIAPTDFESLARQHIDTLDGWGVGQPLTIPFTGPIDVNSIIAGHRDVDYDPSNDVIYLIDITPGAPTEGQLTPIDLGEGNFPVTLERLSYWKNDPRGHIMSLAFEEVDEDINGNGILDRGEDTDSDGVLDKPNYLPGVGPIDRDDLKARADALMYFYERETHTIIAHPLVPLRERSTYAVVVTRRLLDAEGQPVGSPFPFINHTSQTKALENLPNLLPEGLSLDDVAFAFSFTTQTVESAMVAVRNGLYGEGVQAHIGAEFEPVVSEFFPLIDRNRPQFADRTSPFLMKGDDFVGAYEIIAAQLQGKGGETLDLTVGGHRSVGFHVVGSFDSPQLYPRTNEAGEPLDLNNQIWPPDLTEIPAPVRTEKVYFWLSVPKKEVSARGLGEPAPLVMLAHGYTSNRFSEVAGFGGYLATQGLATIGIDCPSHGLSISPDEEETARILLDGFGLLPFAEAALTDRAFDQNGDGRPDSGADFWTAYVFHTRDVVRQCMLDYMQLIRIIDSFDGERVWAHDVNGDGVQEKAGDFDGDGYVDIGRDSTLGMLGGSLGGMMSLLVGSVEPKVDAIAPIAGGGALGNIGLRSTQGGVREAVILRIMGPLYTGTRQDDGTFHIETIVPDLNDDAARTIARLPADTVSAGDTFVVENKANGEIGCGVLTVDGTVRVSVPSDAYQSTEIRLYKGTQLVLGSTECEIEEGETPYETITTFGEAFEFQAKNYAAGDPLVSLAQGRGEARGTPGMRRFLGLGQIVLDPADPAVYARYLSQEPLVYASVGPDGVTPETTRTNALIVTTLGDMAVPASGGIHVGRAAGLVEYQRPDPRYDLPPNQVLLDSHVAEAVHTVGRHLDGENGVHLDVENFSEGADLWGARVPRLERPLRLVGPTTRDAPELGISGAIFPMSRPDGQHGFDMPAEQRDRFRNECQSACAEGMECDCEPTALFDIGSFMFSMIGQYLQSGGLFYSDDSCQGLLGGCPEPND